jgi:N-acetylglucosaminyl-diphospho-decaprenol L-rhamnosyltransferase
VKRDYGPLDLTVVLVSYNSREVILSALAPLVGVEGVDVIVVDNDSQDSTVSGIETEFPSVRVMKMSENLGFAKAVNLGIESCGTADVMLLNPDAVVSIASVQTLVCALAEPGSGIVAPLIEDQGTRLGILPAGRFPTIWRMLLHFSGISRMSAGRRALWGHYLFPANVTSRRLTVDWVTGACMVFSKDTWDLAGRLNEGWFMYAEDIDFCFRVRSLGLSVRLLSDATASHLVGQSDSSGSYSANPAWILNLHDFYNSQLSRSALHSFSWCLVVSLGLLSRSWAYWLKSVDDKKNDVEWSYEAARFRVFSLAVLQRAVSTLRPASGGKSAPRNRLLAKPPL